MRVRGLILTILLGSCASPESAVINSTADPSDPSCPELSESENNRLVPQVTRYFLAEVGVDVGELTIYRGSRCGEAAVFLIVVGEMPPRPFFVEVDLRSKHMKLGRPE